MNMIWLHLTSTPIPVVKVQSKIYTVYSTKNCLSVRILRQYDVKRYVSHFKYVNLSTNSVTAGFELGGGLPSAWREWAGGGERVAHAVLYWPVLEVEWQATPCRAPPCSPSLCGVVWSTPMRRRFLWPASEHMATGWEDEGGWCAGSVLCNTEFLHCPDHSPSQHTATLYDKGVMLMWATSHINLEITIKGKTDVYVTNFRVKYDVDTCCTS